MGRKPNGLTVELQSLRPGESVVVKPEPGESLPDALKRLRSGLPRTKVDLTSFRCEIDGSAVRIHAVPKGRGKAASLKSMKAGQYLLVSRSPSPSDIKKARDRASYASLSKGTGVWEVVIDQVKGLMIVCVVATDGSSAIIKSGTYVPDEAEVITAI